MATAKEVITTVDAWLATALPAFAKLQAAHFAKYGRYWQGLPTHTTPPDEGKTGFGDKLQRKPGYQAEGWDSVELFMPTAPCCVQVDQYIGPDGAGYTLTVSFTAGKEVWKRVIHSGPEKYRERGWSTPPQPKVFPLPKSVSEIVKR